MEKRCLILKLKVDSKDPKKIYLLIQQFDGVFPTDTKKKSSDVEEKMEYLVEKLQELHCYRYTKNVLAYNRSTYYRIDNQSKYSGLQYQVGENSFTQVIVDTDSIDKYYQIKPFLAQLKASMYASYQTQNRIRLYAKMYNLDEENKEKKKRKIKINDFQNYLIKQYEKSKEIPIPNKKLTKKDKKAQKKKGKNKNKKRMQELQESIEKLENDLIKVSVRTGTKAAQLFKELKLFGKPFVTGGAKAAGKAAAKTGGESFLKKIPLLGLGIGVALGVTRAIQGEYAQAGAEILSGAVSCIPVIGTGASIAIDLSILGYDYMEIKKIQEQSDKLAQNYQEMLKLMLSDYYESDYYPNYHILIHDIDFQITGELQNVVTDELLDISNYCEVSVKIFEKGNINFHPTESKGKYIVYDESDLIERNQKDKNIQLIFNTDDE